MDEAIKEYNRKLEELRLKQATQRKSHQNDLLYQMNEKERLREKELHEKILQERAAKLWEMEYNKKIQEKKAQHHERVYSLFKGSFNILKKEAFINYLFLS